MNTITRRSLARGGALGLVGAMAAPAVAQTATRRWRMVTSWPKRLPGPGMSAERVAARIGALSGGRFEITVSAAGEVVPAFEVLDAVGSGVAEMGHTAAFYWQGKMPAAAFFTTVPFGLTPNEHVVVDRRRRRPGVVGRALCAVRRQAVHGRQYRRLHGRLVPPRAQTRCRRARPQNAFARSRRRSLSPARRHPADDVAWRNSGRAAIRRDRRRRIRRPRLRHRARSLSLRAVLLRTRLQQAERHRRVHCRD